MTSSESPANSPKRAGFRLSSARLAAVQALYEMDLSGAPADPVLASFMESRWRTVTLRDPDEKPEKSAQAKLSKPDPEYLSALVRGTTANLSRIDEIIQSHLSAEWTVERLHALLRAILRAGTFEILERKDVPARTVVTEYRDLAFAFVEEKEAAFANGVIFQVARAFRPDEVAD